MLIVNTCSFIEAARAESVRTILDAAKLKADGRREAGGRRRLHGPALPRRAHARARRGRRRVRRIGRARHDRRGGGSGASPAAPRRCASDLPMFTQRRSPAISTTPRPRARWRRRRGPRSSRSRRGATTRARFARSRRSAGRSGRGGRTTSSRRPRRLARRGVREINLIAQDSSHYGRDHGDAAGLAGLLARLDGVAGLRWIRVHYLYPNTVDRSLDRDDGAAARKVVKYVDMPLQHAHPAVLKRMRRGGSAESHLELIGRFREAMPDVAMRSTFIVGFPGETDEEFDDARARSSRRPASTISASSRTRTRPGRPRRRSTTTSPPRSRKPAATVSWPPSRRSPSKRTRR